MIFFLKESKSKKKIFFPGGGGGLCGGGGGRGLMGRQMKRPKPIWPFNFFEIFFVVFKFLFCFFLVWGNEGWGGLE